MQTHDSLPIENDDFDLTLQRLVDGELDRASMKAFLANTECDSHKWRSIACAFVEEQLFEKQFVQTVDDRVAESVRRPTVSSDKANPKPLSRNAPITHSSSPLMRQLAFVASVAVAGLIGFLIAGGNEFSSSTNGPGASGSDIAGNQLSKPDVGRITPANLEPEYQLELLSPDGESIDSEVDLYRYDDLRQLVSDDESEPAGREVLENVMPKSDFSEEDRLRMSRSGFVVIESTDYVSGRLQDGRQFVVPVRSVRIDRGY